MKLPVKKMYILVRKELDATYRCVQGAHSLAQYLMAYPEMAKEWNNEFLIFLGVRFPSDINKWAKILESNNIKYEIFYEPDIQEITALACYCQENIFKNLDLV